MRRTPIDFTLDPAALLDRVLRLRPEVIYGNRSSFQQLIAELAARGRRLQGVRLAVITGEVITKQMRADCEEWCGVRPIETYGSVEVGVMAYETPDRQGMRLGGDLILFEFRDEEGGALPAGRSGRVLVTSLHGSVMPFIRYDHGDRVAYADVPDGEGRVSRRLTEIFGRDNDLLRLPDGRVVTFLSIYEIIGRFQELRQFRVIQEEPTLFRVLLVGDPGAVANAAPGVQDGLSRVLGRSAGVIVERVDRLPVDPSGKIRVVESRVGMVVTGSDGADRVPR
jgi:phenylacetate-CoA ligase